MVMAILYLPKRENSRMHGWIVYKTSKMMKQSIILGKKLNRNKEGKMFSMMKNINLRLKNSRILNNRTNKNKERKMNRKNSKRRINLVVNK